LPQSSIPNCFWQRRFSLPGASGDSRTRIFFRCNVAVIWTRTVRGHRRVADTARPWTWTNHVCDRSRECLRPLPLPVGGMFQPWRDGIPGLSMDRLRARCGHGFGLFMVTDCAGHGMCMITDNLRTRQRHGLVMDTARLRTGHGPGSVTDCP
jgi:hypothetical protein